MPKVNMDQAREEILQLMAAWTSAVSTVKNYAFFDRHLAEGWSYTDYHGVRREKGEYLKLVDTIAAYGLDVQQFDMRILGEDIVVTSGVYRSWAELKNGIKLANTIAFSWLWQIQDGVWKALLIHTTKIPDPS